MADLNATELAGAIVFDVKVIPRSSRTAIAGLLGGMLKIKVSAPAEKGKANKCLIKFLAKKLNVKSSAISIISGRINSVKQIRVTGISPDDLLTALEAG